MNTHCGTLPIVADPQAVLARCHGRAEHAPILLVSVGCLTDTAVIEQTIGWALPDRHIGPSCRVLARGVLCTPVVCGWKGRVELPWSIRPVRSRVHPNTQLRRRGG